MLPDEVLGLAVMCAGAGLRMEVLVLLRKA